MVAALLGTRGRVTVLVITAVLGILAAVALGLAGEPGLDRFETISSLVQLVMSVTLPFLGVLLVSELRHRRDVPIGPRFAAAGLAAVVTALVGSGLAAAATSTSTAPDRWQHVPSVVIGTVVLQLVAQGVGTGFGLLVGRRWLAMAMTVVVPLGLWLGLSLIGLTAIRDWTLPVIAAQRVFTGGLTAYEVGRWLVVIVIWVVAPNAWGLVRRRKRLATAPMR